MDSMVRKLDFARLGVDTVSVSSVDGYQGREADAVVLSTVRSNPVGRLGFVTDARRLNVAITRAKRALVVVGSDATLAANPLWADYLAWLGARTGGPVPEALVLDAFERTEGLDLRARLEEIRAEESAAVEAFEAALASASLGPGTAAEAPRLTRDGSKPRASIHKSRDIPENDILSGTAAKPAIPVVGTSGAKPAAAQASAGPSSRAVRPTGTVARRRKNDDDEDDVDASKVKKRVVRKKPE